MVLKEMSSGKELEAVIEPVTDKDFRVIRNDKVRFDKFDWSKYQGEEVYKLRLKSDETILGLLCLIDHSDAATNAIEIELLEVSDENIGQGKKLQNIAGCLIAYACRESFKRGHDGCVFLIPKTELLDHYQARYGFLHLPLRTDSRPEGLMIIHEEESQKLIRKYLG